MRQVTKNELKHSSATIEAIRKELNEINFPYIGSSKGDSHPTFLCPGITSGLIGFPIVKSMESKAISLLEYLPSFVKILLPLA